MTINKPTDFDAYAEDFSEETQELLREIRTIVQKCAPEAEEVISYAMPAFKLHGMLVYYAAYDNHIGFYPGASGVEAFKDELSEYKTSKGTIQFQIGKSLPTDLITRIVEFRVRENLDKKLANIEIKKKRK